jgi:hypothetical protein
MVAVGGESGGKVKKGAKSESGGQNARRDAAEREKSKKTGNGCEKNNIYRTESLS